MLFHGYLVDSLSCIAFCVIGVFVRFLEVLLLSGDAAAFFSFFSIQ